MRMTAWVVAVLLTHAVPAMGQGVCPPKGADLKSLQLIKQQGFAVDAATRGVLVEALLPCLGNADPALRDGIAYEAYAAWMRGRQLDAGALRKLRDRLYCALQQPDEAGFRRPFAALVLSEVARTDRVEPWMTKKERAAMVRVATGYLAGVHDYRGFVDGEGWRHGVAHGSDWLMQLALNPALERGQLDAILQAVARQAVPESAHAYVFGEPGRLARPVLYAARRGVLGEREWTDWFGALPARLGDPAKAYNDAAWLAKRHDLLAFLTAIHLEADQADDANIRALKAPALAAIRAIP